MAQEELEVPYEVMKYERMPNLFAPQELTTIHPLGKCPVIKDGAIVLCESGAIVGKTYIAVAQGLIPQ